MIGAKFVFTNNNTVAVFIHYREDRQTYYYYYIAGDRRSVRRMHKDSLYHWIRSKQICLI